MTTSNLRPQERAIDPTGTQQDMLDQGLEMLQQMRTNFGTE